MFELNARMMQYSSVVYIDMDDPRPLRRPYRNCTGCAIMRRRLAVMAMVIACCPGLVLAACVRAQSDGGPDEGKS